VQNSAQGYRRADRQLADNGARKARSCSEVKARKGNEGYDVATMIHRPGEGRYRRIRRRSPAARAKTLPRFSGLLLTTKPFVTELPEKEKTPPMRARKGGMADSIPSGSTTKLKRQPDSQSPGCLR